MACALYAQRLTVGNVAYCKALAALTAPVYDDYMPLLEELKLTHELHQVGALWVYETKAAFKADSADRDLRRSYGIIFDEMDGDEARKLEPALGKAVVRAAMTPQWSHFDDPKRVVDRLHDLVVERGAKTVTGEAVAIEGAQLRLAGGEAVDFDQLIIATGAWSARLAKTIGDRVLLESERGYNITIPNSGVSLTREVILLNVNSWPHQWIWDCVLVVLPSLLGLKLRPTMRAAMLLQNLHVFICLTLKPMKERVGWGIVPQRRIACR